MFDVGFPELILVAVVGLLVIGPERLPEALRTLGLWFGRMRRSFLSVKTEIEKEIGMDEVRRQLHNEAVMDEMKRIEQQVKKTAQEVKNVAKEATIHPKPVVTPDVALDATPDDATKTESEDAPPTIPEKANDG